MSKEEQGQFNVIPDSYLPLDCDGKFRDEDCEYCIEYDECEKKRGQKKNDRIGNIDD